MRKYLLVITAALALAAIVTGCTGPNSQISPAIVQQAVTISVQGGLMAYPQATPEVKIAGAVVCASATATT